MGAGEQSTFTFRVDSFQDGRRIILITSPESVFIPF